jgi:hypothetical protein
MIRHYFQWKGSQYTVDPSSRQHQATTATATCHDNNWPTTTTTRYNKNVPQRQVDYGHNDDGHDGAWGSRRKHVSSAWYVFFFSFFLTLLILFTLDYLYRSRQQLRVYNITRSPRHHQSMRSAGLEACSDMSRAPWVF